VYPGTLTGRETVPTIGIVVPVFDRTIELVYDMNTRNRKLVSRPIPNLVG
jgi:hypothetical protein